MLNFARRFRRDDRGATSIEYGLIAALVFLVALSAIQLYGKNTTKMFDKVAAAVTTAAP